MVSLKQRADKNVYSDEQESVSDDAKDGLSKINNSYKCLLGNARRCFR